MKGANGMMHPVEMNRKLLQPTKGRGKLKKGERSQIWHQLSEVNVDWFTYLLRGFLGEKPKLRFDSPVCKTLVHNWTQKSQGARLVRYFLEACLDKAQTTEEMERFLMFFFSWLGQWPTLSNQILKKSQPNSETRSYLQVLLFYWLKRAGQIEIVDSEDNPAHTFNNDGTSTFLWPAHRSHWPRAEELLAECQAQFAREDRVITETKGQSADWQAADALWQKIQADAYYGLHLGSGDWLQLAIPEIEALRVTGVTLKLEGAFPQARAIVHHETFDVIENVHFDLVDGHLGYGEIWWPEYLCWLITMGVLIGYWQVVSGNENEVDQAKQTGSTVAKAGKTFTRKAAKPHPLTLRSGWRASPRALKNAIKHLGRLPAPGITCRISGKSAPGRFSTKVTAEAIAQMTSELVV
jgi:hypothetical protein